MAITRCDRRPVCNLVNSSRCCKVVHYLFEGGAAADTDEAHARYIRAHYIVGDQLRCRTGGIPINGEGTTLQPNTTLFAPWRGMKGVR